jgi:hypothetical protein
MDKFFYAKFYDDAVASAFSCHLVRSGSDIPEMSQGMLGVAALSDIKHHSR